MSYAGSVCRPCQIGCYEPESRAHMPPGLWRCPDCLRCYRGGQEIGTEEWELGVTQEGRRLHDMSERERAVLRLLAWTQDHRFERGLPTATVSTDAGAGNSAGLLRAMRGKHWVEMLPPPPWPVHQPRNTWRITPIGRAALAAEEGRNDPR